MSLQQIEDKIRSVAFQRRVRTNEFIRDFDPLRSKLITSMQLQRSLSMLGVQLSNEEFAILKDAYMDATWNKIAYEPFTQSIDKGKIQHFCN